MVEVASDVFQGELTASDLQALDETATKKTRHLFSTSEGDRRQRWLLLPPGGPNNKILAPFKASDRLRVAITCASSPSQRVRSRSGERPADGQRARAMNVDAATTAIGDLVLGERGKEASGGRSLPDRIVGGWRHRFDGWQAKSESSSSMARRRQDGSLHAMLDQAPGHVPRKQRRSCHRRRAARTRPQRPGSWPDRA